MRVFWAHFCPQNARRNNRQNWPYKILRHFGLQKNGFLTRSIFEYYASHFINILRLTNISPALNWPFCNTFVCAFLTDFNLFFPNLLVCTGQFAPFQSPKFPQLLSPPNWTNSPERRRLFAPPPRIFSSAFPGKPVTWKRGVEVLAGRTRLLKSCPACQKLHSSLPAER